MNSEEKIIVVDFPAAPRPARPLHHLAALPSRRVGNTAGANSPA